MSRPSLSGPLLASAAWAVAYLVGARLGVLYEVLFVTALLASGLLAWRGDARAWLQGGLRRPLLSVGVGLLAGAASLAATSLLYPLVAARLPSLRAEVGALYALGAPSGLAFVALLIIPLAEELIWRGALLDALTPRVGERWGVLVAALVYAAAQSGALSAWLVLAAALLGTLWGALRVLTGGLVAPALSHVIWTCGVLVLFPLERAPA